MIDPATGIELDPDVAADARDADYQGFELLGPDPEEFLGPRRYKINCMCTRCGKEYSYVVTKITKKNRPCPDADCRADARAEARRQADANMAQMLEEQRPPGHIGDKPMNRVIDYTAQAAMEDYGLTNLRDNIREGESAAPKLPAAQQRAADGFFNGKEVARQSGSRRAAHRMSVLAAKAMAGSYKNMTLDPRRVMLGQPGDPVLHSYKTEKL